MGKGPEVNEKKGMFERPWSGFLRNSIWEICMGIVCAFPVKIEVNECFSYLVSNTLSQSSTPGGVSVRQQPVMLQTNQVKVWQSGQASGGGGHQGVKPTATVTPHTIGDTPHTQTGGGSNIIKIPAGATVSVGGPQIISPLVMGDNGK